MKVSKENHHLNSMNMSNEFVDQHLHDEVKYKVTLKNLSEVNDLAERFVNKQRVIKEKSALGGFRIPQETLKKRVNPSETNFGMSNAGHNPTVNSFSFNPYFKGAETAQSHLSKYRQNIASRDEEDIDPPYDADLDLGSNLIEVIEKEVDKLKRDSEELLKIKEMQGSRIKSSAPDLDEKKVITQYLSYNTDRVQAIKHVSTQFKPEYMSLEELQKAKEEHEKKMLQVENEYFARKRKDQQNSNLMSKMSEDDDRFNKLKQMDIKHMDSRKINPEELKDILDREQEFAKREQNRKKNFRARSKSAKAIKRVGMSAEKLEEPLDKEDERFVKKYANYVMKKKVSRNTTEKPEEDWNKTKIKSQNVNGVVDRPDGLPGHLDRDDYSMYYYSIASNTPRSLSINSVSHSRSYSKSGTKKSKHRSKINRSLEAKGNKRVKSANHKNNHTHLHKHSSKRIQSAKKMQMNSHLAFLKLIYNLLDKDKKGVLPKSEITKDLNLEENILKDLGFVSHLEFKQALESFPTQIENQMTEQELIAFLLSRSDLAEEYLYNYRAHMEDGNMMQENNYEFHNYNNNLQGNNPENFEIQFFTENNGEQNNEDYPGMSTNQMEFLQYQSTGERLEKLRESYSMSSSHKNFHQSNSKIKQHNSNLTKSLKKQIDSDSKVNVTYKDYTNFLNKYQTKGELNFTIPKPFEFLKNDYSSKKMAKIQEILEERKRIEDEILGFRFKPNELKREIFISQFENVIEAERANRKYRTEKIKEKIIQNMKPFSFYETDERKYKEKIQRVAEPPQFAPFKANAVPWTSQVTMYDDIIKKMEVQRLTRVEQRAMETQKMAKLPPRMEMHEKKKKQQEQEMKLLDKMESKQRSKSFKATVVPNFAKAHETFMKTLEKKKSIAKPTEPVPFNFHEPKKKASLRGYLDQENDPQSKNPQFKRNITEVIQKIQQKPKIEPASTKALNLLMATRRKELEERQRKEEEKLLEDKMRKEKQDRLKERVVNSKALVDNTKSLEDKRSKQQEDFKKGLQDKKQAYQQDLARRLQRVYNKPLMFETSAGKVEKFSMNKNMKDKLNDILYKNSEDPSMINDNNNDGNNEDELYEGKFDN